jgi:CRP/FNR family cyclic AMP-dependent transcriptional regulator
MTGKPPSPDPERPVTDVVLRTLADIGTVRNYPRQTVLISEGDHSSILYVILAGRVRVYATSGQGREITLAFHGPGEMLGELALSGEPRSASVITIEPTTCLAVPIAAFREAIVRSPDLALFLIHKLISRVRLATESVKSLALSDVYGRLRRLLEELAVEREGERVLCEAMTQQELADRVGASRDMVNRVLRDLATGGYVRISRKAITLLKPLPSRY